MGENSAVASSFFKKRGSITSSPATITLLGADSSTPTATSPPARACCTYVLDFFSGLVRSVLNFFGTSVVKSVSVEDELNDIADSFGEYRCKEAAQSMADYLTQNGHKAQIVEITFWGGRGYVWSDIAQRTISENGTHVGVLFNGLVFCNVHPYGLPEATWIADFHGAGTKQVVKIPIG